MTVVSRTPAVLAYPFRIFFLAAGAYALLLIAGWVLFLFAAWSLPLGWAPMQWHTHEMLYGFVTAAIAGFVLTAMTNWTGAPPLKGIRLLFLFLLWCAGRAVMWMASWLPGWLAAVVDLAFLPVLAVYVAVTLLRFNNRRNLILVGVLILLFVGNLIMQLGLATGRTSLLQLGQLLGLDLISLLIVIIAGRITPAFTGNWLRKIGGDPQNVKRIGWIEAGAIGAMILLLISDFLPLSTVIAASLALLAAGFNAVRLFFWRGWLTLREPLLWILHLAYLWLVLALALRGLAIFFDGIPATLWQHALGLGAIATLILGVMTRVAVGHTGRPLRLLRFGLLAYLAMIAATVVRMLVAVGVIDFRLGITVAATAWMVAFSIFLIVYAPVLLSPRADGRPG